MAAANSALPSMEMKIMSIKSTANTAINPSDDVNAITVICRINDPVRNFACASAMGAPENQ